MKPVTDFHIHTYYSDGRYSPQEIVKMYKLDGYEKIAITDHDGTDGIPEGLQAAEIMGIELIPGIELTAEYLPKEEEKELWRSVPLGENVINTEKAFELHILGYHIDRENKRLKEACSFLREKRRERNAKLLVMLAKEGFPLEAEELLKHGNSDFAGKPDFVRAFNRHGYEIEDPWQLLDRIDREKIPVEEIISVIKEASGVPVLAHPMKTRGLYPKKEGMVDRAEILIEILAGYGIEGIECIHPSAGIEESKRFASEATRFGLLKTRGSDFHG